MAVFTLISKMCLPSGLAAQSTIPCNVGWKTMITRPSILAGSYHFNFICFRSGVLPGGFFVETG